jgi:hypothetical protein
MVKGPGPVTLWSKTLRTLFYALGTGDLRFYALEPKELLSYGLGLGDL